MSKPLWLAAAASVLIVLCACRQDSEIKVYASDTGSEIACKPGDVIRLSLEANPTTGYDWEVIEPVDDSVIQVGEREFDSSGKDQELVGVGGVDLWRIRCARQGRARLDLVYRRHWEKDEEPLNEFLMEVVVQSR